MKPYMALPLLLLGGCVAAQFHTTGTSNYSAITANQSCAHAYDPVNRVYAPWGSLGLMGAAIGAAGELSSPEYADAGQVYDECMAGYGWARN